MYLFLRKHPPPHSNSQKTTTEKSILILKTCKRHLILHFIFCNSFYSSGTVWNTETVCGDVSTHHSPTASSLHVKPSFRAGSFRRNHLQWCREKKVLPDFPNTDKSDCTRLKSHSQKWIQTPVTNYCISGEGNKDCNKLERGTRVQMPNGLNLLV